MRRDYLIAIILFAAAGFFGVAVMVAPEYLHLPKEYLGAIFWSGTALMLLSFGLAVVIALRGEAQSRPKGHTISIVAIIGMIVCAAGFIAWANIFYKQQLSVQVSPTVENASATEPKPVEKLETIEKAERIFVGKEITPKYLMNLYREHAAIQADKLVAAYLGRVDKQDSQISHVLIQGCFGGGCRDPRFVERQGMGLS